MACNNPPPGVLLSGSHTNDHWYGTPLVARAISLRLSCQTVVNSQRIRSAAVESLPGIVKAGFRGGF